MAETLHGFKVPKLGSAVIFGDFHLYGLEYVSGSGALKFHSTFAVPVLAKTTVTVDVEQVVGSSHEDGFVTVSEYCRTASTSFPPGGGGTQFSRQLSTPPSRRSLRQSRVVDRPAHGSQDPLVS
jgi:hypothetical protein